MKAHLQGLGITPEMPALSLVLQEELQRSLISCIPGHLTESNASTPWRKATPNLGPWISIN